MGQICSCMHWTKLLQLCLTFCNPVDHRHMDSSVHRNLQERILEWVTMPISSVNKSWVMIHWGDLKMRYCAFSSGWDPSWCVEVSFDKFLNSLHCTIRLTLFYLSQDLSKPGAVREVGWLTSLYKSLYSQEYFESAPHGNTFISKMFPFCFIMQTARLLQVSLQMWNRLEMHYTYQSYHFRFLFQYFFPLSFERPWGSEMSQIKNLGKIIPKALLTQVWPF